MVNSKSSHENNYLTTTTTLACVVVHTAKNDSFLSEYVRGLELQDRWLVKRGHVRQIDLAVGFRATLSFGTFLWVSKEKYKNIASHYVFNCLFNNYLS